MIETIWCLSSSHQKHPKYKLTIPFVSFSVSVVPPDSLPYVFILRIAVTFLVAYSQVKPTTATPFLFPSCSSAENFHFPSFYIRRYSLASPKQWHFVFCIYICQNYFLPEHSQLVYGSMDLLQE